MKMVLVFCFVDLSCFIEVVVDVLYGGKEKECYYWCVNLDISNNGWIESWLFEGKEFKGFVD